MCFDATVGSHGLSFRSGKDRERRATRDGLGHDSASGRWLRAMRRVRPANEPERPSGGVRVRGRQGLFASRLLRGVGRGSTTRCVNARPTECAARLREPAIHRIAQPPVHDLAEFRPCLSRESTDRLGTAITSNRRKRRATIEEEACEAVRMSSSASARTIAARHMFVSWCVRADQHY